MHQIPHLRSLHERMFDRGLVVVGVTGGTKKALQAFLDKTPDMIYPVAIGSWESGYDHRGIPACVLVDAEGIVRFAGHPAELEESLIEKTLEGARPANVAAGLEEVAELQRTGKPGAAFRKAQELLDGGGLSEAAAAQARDRMARMTDLVGSSLDGAATAVTDEDYHLAWTQLDAVANGGYDGVPRAEEAAARLAELLADKKIAREIDAGKQLAELLQLVERRDYDDAYGELKKLSSRQRSTRAGKRAKELADELKDGGKLGYNRSCGACQAGDRACPRHGKKR
ncbi:MAG: hypothetical protein AB7O97_06380 [Planctomycetota bacterium]